MDMYGNRGLDFIVEIGQRKTRPTSVSVCVCAWGVCMRAGGRELEALIRLGDGFAGVDERSQEAGRGQTEGWADWRGLRCVGRIASQLPAHALSCLACRLWCPPWSPQTTHQHECR